MDESEDYFPFLDTDEKQVTLKFCSSCDNKSSPESEKNLNEMLKLIKRLYTTLCQLPLGSELRTIFRAKLMNIAGIYTLIPPQKVLSFIEKESDSPPLLSAISPFFNSLIDQELSLEQLLGLSFFTPLFQLSNKALGKGYSYLETLKRYCHYLVFSQDIQNETFAKRYLTSSSEPLSQTIVLNLQDPEGRPRDPLSLGIDIIYQCSYLEVFYKTPQNYKADYCEQLAKKQAMDFAESAHHYIKDNPSLSQEFESFRSMIELSEAPSKT